MSNVLDVMYGPGLCFAHVLYWLRTVPKLFGRGFAYRDVNDIFGVQKTVLCFEKTVSEKLLT